MMAGSIEQSRQDGKDSGDEVHQTPSHLCCGGNAAAYSSSPTRSC
jgi:hypothetical protein